MLLFAYRLVCQGENVITSQAFIKESKIYTRSYLYFRDLTKNLLGLSLKI